MPGFSDAYIAHADQGPFPRQVDPWSEKGTYFHAIHMQMIGNLLTQLHPTLRQMGYRIGRERSLQIAQGRQPDLHVEQQLPRPQKQHWNYAQTVQSVLHETLTAIESTDADLDALYIRAADRDQLVAVIEVVSPANKVSYEEIRAYQQRRDHLMHQSVHIVEIDLTRSVKRLVDDKLVEFYPYHIAIYLYDQPSYLMFFQVQEAIKPFMLPLRQEAIAVDLQVAYRQAYEQNSTALQILNDNGYGEDDLPFPSLLSEQQRRHLLEKVEVWRVELARLRDNQEIG